MVSAKHAEIAVVGSDALAPCALNAANAFTAPPLGHLHHRSPRKFLRQRPNGARSSRSAARRLQAPSIDEVRVAGKGEKH